MAFVGKPVARGDAVGQGEERAVRQAAAVEQEEAVCEGGVGHAPIVQDAREAGRPPQPSPPFGGCASLS